MQSSRSRPRTSGPRSGGETDEPWPTPRSTGRGLFSIRKAAPKLPWRNHRVTVPIYVGDAGMIDTESFVVVGVVAAVLLIAALLRKRPQSGDSASTSTVSPAPAAAKTRPPSQAEAEAQSRHEAAVRQRFLNAEPMVPPHRQESMIQSCMRANRCSRTEAMQIILGELKKDTVKFD
jgi:hypothetical protein